MKQKSGRKWRKKYLIPKYIKDTLFLLQPPEELLVSEWAGKYRILDFKTSAIPGPWRNDKTPYLKEIMDELINYETEEIIFCKCTQVGGSEAMLNMLGYVIQQDPSPIMVVYPTDKLGESTSENRIKPMIKSSPSLNKLFHEFQSQKLELQFEGMYLTIAGSNSPSSLASKAIKYLFLDEVDKYPGASRKEADPISLAKERTKTFANRKIYMTSTPTFRTGAIWKALETADVEKHYFVPCPHCGEKIELKFKQIKWPAGGEGITAADRADQAVYVCQECSSVITDQQKDKILRLGEWRIVRENNSVRKKIGFWLSTLYSPFVRFSDIALEFLNSHEDSEKLQNFTNSWLAEPWEDTKLKMEEEMVMERRTELPEFIVPDWARLLTGGVDVQETCLYWTIRAWGNYITSQNIAHGQATSWNDVERMMNLAYEKQGGGSLVVSLCLIDSGYDTDSTYDFCVNNSDWAVPVKGSSHVMDNHFKVSKVNKPNSKAYGMNLIIVDSGKYKDMIAARMHKKNGDGAWMVYSTCDLEYAKQVTAEHKVNVKAGTRVVQKWQEKYSHAANHYLDCEVYAFAAADIMGVRSMHLEMIEPLKTEDPKKVVEETWIPADNNWI
ncbi:MAG: phage terminase large subunit family protein [Lachnospiraceae bacterium]|nr:phage terminase large subunit family protein [Lachnospiraceae bacterium]